MRTVPAAGPALSPGLEIPSLDGIRALAVSLVFLAHAGLEHLIPGGLGVTIFFVLSGYLITTLMRHEHSRHGSVGLRAFYLRRFLRLMPPLLIVVALAALLSSLSAGDAGFSLRGLLSVLFYFGNYHVIAYDFEGLPAGMGVVWSLAVEEHYYLLYPPLAIALLNLGRLRLAAGVLMLLCAAILGWRCWLAAQGASEAYLTMATDTRADSILVGCVMALVRNPVLDPVAPANPRRDWGLVALCTGVLIATLIYRDDFFRLSLRHTLQSLAIAPLIYLAVARATQPPFRWLNAAPMVYLGTISYTVYLSHHLILSALTRQAPELGGPAVLVIGAVLTLAVAEPLRRGVEQPLARLRKQLHAKAARRTSAPVSAQAAVQ